MTYIHSIILGLVQGVTEFLPISSSAHLVFVQSYLRLNPKDLISFDVFLHFGTLLAVVVALREHLIKITQAVFSFNILGNKNIPQTDEKKVYFKLFWLLVIGTLPAGIIGVVFKSKFEEIFSSTSAAASFLIITGFILWFTRYFGKGNTDKENIGLRQTLWIGFAQAIAILPGISRSGSTITAGLVQKLDKKFAAEFSFLLSVPVILGATLLEIKHIIHQNISQDLLINYLAGTFTAFIFGRVAIKFLIKFIQRNTFYLFGYYCWIVGALVLIFSNIKI